ALLSVNEGKLIKQTEDLYRLTVTGMSVDKIKLLVRSEDAAATIKVQGITVGRNVGNYFPLQPYAPVSQLNVVITAEDGVTQKNYTLLVNNQPSANANLALLSVNEGKLTKVDEENYTVDLSNAATSRIKLLVRSADDAATIKVGTTVVERNVGNYFPLSTSGSTTLLTVVITAEDNITEKAYNVTINKPVPPMDKQAFSLTAKSDLMTTKPVTETVLAYALTPHQALSPNGDGISDYFEIEGITAYPDNIVTIINRSGAKVYEAKGYDNRSKVFNGHSSLNGAMQPEGTYFFLIDYTYNGQKNCKTGYLIMKN
ncbi:MAG: gliding motility-associated C-terminal domain-containing protein, partial [Bacteroidota bacterium]